jgi:hypothetical protein
VVAEIESQLSFNTSQDSHENVEAVATSLLANIVAIGGIVPIGPMKTYVPKEAMWALVDDGKSKPFTHYKVLEHISNYSFTERDHDDVFQHIHSTTLRNWLSEETGVIADLDWLNQLRFQWRKESDRMVGLYAFVFDPKPDKPIRCLALDMYVYPDNSGMFRTGHIYHVCLVERRNLDSL